jgi:nucleotide-binding universal stress UspA family protein
MMSHKKNLLIPLDGSPFSLQVLESVKQFLPPEEYTLILLQVIAEPVGMIAGPAQPAAAAGGAYTPMYTSHQDALRAHHPIYATQEEESQFAAIRGAMQNVINQLTAWGYTVDLAVRFGEPVEEIVNFVPSRKIDLVAMTTHGRSGLSRLIFGSVAAELIGQLDIPIFLLRPFKK